MLIANIGFTCGSHSFKAGDEVPKNLPHNADRIKRGLVREVKVVKPKETKVVKNEPTDSKRKSKNTTKRSKQSNK